MKFSILFGLVFILSSVFVSGIGGTWVEPDTLGQLGCNVFQHVMCSEFSTDTSVYDPLTGLRPYNTLLQDKSDIFCVIRRNDPPFGPGFGFINASNLTYIKDNRANYLADVTCEPVSYGSTPRHYDEQCMADEFFPERHLNGSLDLRWYRETFDGYDKLHRVQYSPGNIDNFNLISGQCGGFIYGHVTDYETGEPVEGATITLFFQSNAGVDEYLTFTTNEDGYYQTLLPRNIQTDYGVYTNINKIPITSYIIVVKHPLYQDHTSSTITLQGGAQHNVQLRKGTVCTSDCTYLGGSVCRKECAGINGCVFPSIEGANLTELLHFVPRNTLFNFNISDQQWAVRACIGEPYKVDQTTIGQGANCPDGTNVWKTTRLVRLNGQLVTMVLTVCE